MASDYGYGGGGYERARRGVENQYTTDAATNAYGRFISQQRGQRSLSDLDRTMRRSYAPVTASWGARGLSGGGINSGAMQQSMANFLGDYYRDRGRTTQDITQSLQQYDLMGSQLQAARENALMDIELQKARDIAGTADALTQLQQYLGGL